MKRRLWIAAGGLLLGCGVVLGVAAVERVVNSQPELPSYLPEGALLSIEARDFGSLLRDWNTSEEKRAWLSSDNYSAFSTSRLFGRLSQAQDEFSAAAGIPADASLLERVAGKESCLGLYDIGNLEFVYVTRLDQGQIESTPLWQMRGKFEQRSEAGSAFYVRKDAQSSRTAAFAARDGWLILGTREDLVAGVLDRIASGASHSLSGEGWYAEAVKQAAGERGDLRMALNLEKIVPSPYFRSYWVQRNITEMKQYASAVSDLYRTNESYREERVLLRRAGITPAPRSDVRSLAALAPQDAAFYAAGSASSPESVLKNLREKLLEQRPEHAQREFVSAPAAAVGENAGNAAQLDTAIDVAPVTVRAADAYQPLRALLSAAQPDGVLEVYATRAPSAGVPNDGVFVSIETAMVLTSQSNWDENAVRQALTNALLPGLTAGTLGAQWEKRASANGEYLALDGNVPLYLKVTGKQLLLANDTALLEKLMARAAKAGPANEKEHLVYEALFQSRQERDNFRRLSGQLDLAGHRGGSDGRGPSTDGQPPAFFSGNMAGLARVFSRLETEQIEEKDLGSKITQSVTYRWQR